MIFAQIIFAFFSLFAISRTVIRFRKKEIPIIWFLFWIIFWIIAIIVVLLPWTTTLLAGWVGIGRGVDLVVYFSVFILFYLIFRVFVRIEGMEKNITKLVEDGAIKEFQKKEEKNLDDKDKK